LAVALAWGVAALVVVLQTATPRLAAVLTVTLAVLPPFALGLQRRGRRVPARMPPSGWRRR
jgi:hypothetical protein